MAKENLRTICEQALWTSHKTLDKLGKEGAARTRARKDIQTKGDKAVFRALKKYFEEINLPAVFDSEEGRPLRLSRNPQILVVSDEIDGTQNYFRNFSLFPFKPLPYCTALSFFCETEEPVFNNCIVAGCIEHATGMTTIGIEGEGLLLNGISYSPAGKREKKPFVIIDSYMNPDVVLKHLGGIHKKASFVRDFGSAAFQISGVAYGLFDAFINPENKSDELGLYRQVKEGDGEILLWDGTSVGEARYRRGATYPIVAARTEKLAREILGEIPKEARKKIMAEYMRQRDLQSADSS